MGSLESRVGVLEAARMSTERQLVRRRLSQLSDAELEALEESLDARARATGEEPPPTNPVLEEIWEEIKQWEAIEQRRHTEESRRRAKKGEME